MGAVRVGHLESWSSTHVGQVSITPALGGVAERRGERRRGNGNSANENNEKANSRTNNLPGDCTSDRFYESKWPKPAPPGGKKPQLNSLKKA
jgi:hypothetical protein